MKTSESLANIGAALSAAMGEIENASKDKAGYGYKYADLAQVLEIARPVLAKNGLSVIQAPHNESGGIAVSTRLLHASGEWIEETLIMPVETTKNLSAAQASGVVITYCRRYALAAMLGIAQEDTDAAKPQTANKVAETTQVRLPEPKKGTRVVDAVLDGVTFDPMIRDKYVDHIKTALMVDDQIALSEMLDELKNDSDMSVAVWAELPSPDRRAIKEFQAARAAA
jgi:hypothetical protein